MKTLVLSVMTLAVLAFATPGALAACSWDKNTTERPQEKVDDVGA